MKNLLFSLGILLGFSANAAAQSANPLPDYEREARWRAEIVPSVVVGDPIDLNVADRKVLALFTTGKPERPAIVLVHGVGVHPDFGAIGQLRVLLADAGYTTLSVQMPVLAKEETNPAQYEKVFRLAHQRLDAAALFLKAKGFVKPILLSHSMGSWMSNDYLRVTPTGPQFLYDRWVCIGITGRIGSTGEHRLPILDIQGEKDLPPVLRAAWLRKLTLAQHDGSKQVEVAGADHYFAGYEKQLAQVIIDWLEKKNTSN